MPLLLDLRINVRVSRGECSGLRLRIARLSDNQLAVILSSDEQTTGRSLTNCFEQVAEHIRAHYLGLWLADGGNPSRLEWYEDRTACRNGDKTLQSGDIVRVHVRPSEPLALTDWVHVPAKLLAERGLPFELPATV